MGIRSFITSLFLPKPAKRRPQPAPEKELRMDFKALREELIDDSMSMAFGADIFEAGLAEIEEVRDAGPIDLIKIAEKRGINWRKFIR